MAFYRNGFSFPKSANMKHPHWGVYLHITRGIVFIVHTPLFGFALYINAFNFDTRAINKLRLWCGWKRQLPYKSGELLYLRNAEWYWGWREAY